MDAVNRFPQCCLHQLIEAQAGRTPGEAAVAFEGERLPYHELDRRAAALAERLLGYGAGPDVRVALLLERSLALVVGIVGILKAGAAYVPIDPTYPDARLRFVLDDSGASMVLTQASLLPRLAAEALPALCIDDPLPAPADNPPVGRACDPRHLAYVIYTSGSTGRPKGVCIEHRNIVNYVVGLAERLGLAPGMHYALVSTIAADLGNTVLFPALASGGCLHVIAQERVESQARLAEYFSREGIDVLKIAPSHLAALQAGANPERVLPRRHLILGGEPCSLDRVRELRAMAPGCEIHNHYGPTETTVGVLTYRVEEALPATSTGTLPLGSPLPNSCVYVLDAQGRPAPPGEAGELFIGGAGVGRGYLNQPALTAERFPPDAFAGHPDARLYRSGDLVRLLPEGGMEFCGRKDQQVKVGGHRVELGEIEQALREHGAVREAVVLARDGRAGEKQLVAYITPKRAQQPLWRHAAVHLLPDGTPVAHLNRSETDYLYHEIFELQAYCRHGISVRDGDCIIDAGANIGLFTVFASRLAQRLRILAFEPNPAAFACLQANAQGSDAAVICLPYGLSSNEHSADLTFFEGMSLLSGFYADAATERSVVEAYVRNQQAVPAGHQDLADEMGQLIDTRLRGRTIRAQLRRLSDVIAEQAVERVDLLKVNVEKSELDVLHGIAPADWPKIRQLVIEVDRRSDLTPITVLLAQQGFEARVEQDPLLRSTELHYVYAIRPGDGRRLTGERASIPALPIGKGVSLLAPASLRKHLSERLPRHMVPAAFVLMERFPLMPNGKIDRLALPPAQIAQPTGQSIGPRTETEKALVALWCELLQVEGVGVDDNFFDLGGHSLMAMRMVARIRDALGADVQLRNLFERPTVAGLAEIVDGLLWARTTAAASVPGAGNREELTL